MYACTYLCSNITCDNCDQLSSSLGISLWAIKFNWLQLRLSRISSRGLASVTFILLVFMKIKRKHFHGVYIITAKVRLAFHCGCWFWQQPTANGNGCSCSCFQLNFTSAQQHPAAPFHLAFPHTALAYPPLEFQTAHCMRFDFSCGCFCFCFFLRQRQHTHMAHAHQRIELIHKNIVYIFIRLAKAINNTREKKT